MRVTAAVSALMLLTTAAIAAEEPPLLRLHGSNTIGAHLAPEMVKEWLAQRGHSAIEATAIGPEETLILSRDPKGVRVSVEIHAHGSSTAFKDLAASRADIGMASRPAKPGEVRSLADHGPVQHPDNEYVIGLDGIAVITHPANPVGRLSKQALRAIFTGEANDWAQVGGQPGPIRLYARDDKSGTYDTFRTLVLGKAPLSPLANRYESNEHLSDDVSADPQGIGFVGLPSIRNAKSVAVFEKDTLPIRPDRFTVATEDYILSRRLFLYLPGHNATPTAREFARFAVSERGQAIVEKVGFVGQHVTAATRAHNDAVPDEYKVFTSGAQRLSLNFRFQDGSARLDAKALHDVERLVEFLRRSPSRKLLLFGFADQNEVIPVHSHGLSVARADMVADLLIERGLMPFRVRGYGAAIPVASNSEPGGRQKNRRVEVWVL